MTNFYDDYSFSPEDFDTINSVLNKTMEKLTEYITPLNDLRVGRELEDFRIIPIQYFDISSALYDAGNIFNSEELKIWFDENTSRNTKTEMLSNKGKYVKFVADRGFPDESGDIPEKYTIVNFKLYDPLGSRLVYNTDYVFKNNRLYLFGDYASWDIRQGNYFKLTDIAVDFNTVDDMLGKNLELKYYPTKMSKSEFNEIVRVLTLAMLKGGTIEGVTEGLSALNNGPEGIQVIDKLTGNSALSSRWNSTLETASTYSPFDFVVYYPAYFSEHKVSLLKTYLDKVRHSYTKYMELAYDSHAELYEGVLSDDWWDSFFKPFVDTKGYAAIEGSDNIGYHVSADVYYEKDADGNIVLNAPLPEGEEMKPVLSSREGDGTIPVALESSFKIDENMDEDSWYDSQQILLNIDDEKYDTVQDAISNNVEIDVSEDSFEIQYTITNDYYSRVGYNMMLY